MLQKNITHDLYCRCVSVKDENLRRMMREMEYLTDDVNTLSQMVDLVATLHCPHGQIEENIREMLGALNKQLNDRHVSESQLSYLELALNTRYSTCDHWPLNSYQHK